MRLAASCVVAFCIERAQLLHCGLSTGLVWCGRGRGHVRSLVCVGVGVGMCGRSSMCVVHVRAGLCVVIVAKSLGVASSPCHRSLLSCYLALPLRVQAGVKLLFEGGSKNKANCHGMFARRTEIQFTCGDSLGSPTFLEETPDCVRTDSLKPTTVISSFPGSVPAHSSRQTYTRHYRTAAAAAAGCRYMCLSGKRTLCAGGIPRARRRLNAMWRARTTSTT